MFGLSLTADVRIIKFKTLLVRPNDLLETELKPLYTNRMPGSFAEYLNIQNAKGLPHPAEPFSFEKQQEKTWGGGGAEERRGCAGTAGAPVLTSAHATHAALFHRIGIKMVPENSACCKIPSPESSASGMDFVLLYQDKTAPGAAGWKIPQHLQL